MTYDLKLIEWLDEQITSKQIVIRDDHDLKGKQVLIRFPNSWGASIIKHKYSHGVELAVIRFVGPDIDDYELRYDTKVTSDVIGYLIPEELAATLSDINDLSDDGRYYIRPPV